jgi:hypothetical protein
VVDDDDDVIEREKDCIMAKRGGCGGASYGEQAWSEERKVVFCNSK